MQNLMLLFIVLALTIPAGVQAFLQTPQARPVRGFWAANFLVALLAIIFVYVYWRGFTP